MRWLVLCFALSASSAVGGVAWDESIDGDFSGDRNAPTPVAVANGSNLLIGSTVVGDLDYLTFTVPAGSELSQLVLEEYSSTDGVAFIAIQAGNVFTEPNVGADPANLLGWSHFGEFAGHLGNDILPEMGSAPGAQGFVPPLPAGDYSLWIQQTSSALTGYTFDLVVQPVPEPASIALAGAAALALGLLARRRTG